MGLFDGWFRSQPVVGIAEDTLRFALEASEQTHPNEYMGLLRGTDADELDVKADGQVITDVLVIPGTESNSVSATMRSNMVPNDRHAVGSIHSHPNGALRPSTQDLQTFSRGEVHIIIGAPYRRDDWRAFDPDGTPTELPIFDVELSAEKDLIAFDEGDL